MKNLKVLKLEDDVLVFQDGTRLYSNHDQDCCENHYLDFSDLTIKDFEGLEFNLTDDKFYKGITEYGIELIPIKGHSVKVPGYGENNGYYSNELELIIQNSDGLIVKEFDITECQVDSW